MESFKRGIFLNVQHKSEIPAKLDRSANKLCRGPTLPPRTLPHHSPVKLCPQPSQVCQAFEGGTHTAKGENYGDK